MNLYRPETLHYGNHQQDLSWDGHVALWSRRIASAWHQVRRWMRKAIKTLRPYSRQTRPITRSEWECHRFDQAVQMTQSQIVLHLHNLSIQRSADQTEDVREWRHRLQIQGQLLYKREIFDVVRWLILKKQQSIPAALAVVFTRHVSVAPTAATAEALRILQHQICGNLKYASSEATYQEPAREEPSAEPADPELPDMVPSTIH